MNALIDESRTDGDTGILGSLVPRLLVCAALMDETAYSDLPELMEDLVKRIQQGDAFAKEKLDQISQAQDKEAERSTWGIDLKGLSTQDRRPRLHPMNPFCL